MGDTTLVAIIYLALLVAGWGLVWLARMGDRAARVAVKSPETLVATVESRVASLVEKSLRENAGEWVPVEAEQPKLGAMWLTNGNDIYTHTEKTTVGIYNHTLGVAIDTWAGPTQCEITLWEKIGPTANKRKIELQPVARARIWGAAKLLIENLEAAKKIDALADVAERIGGVK